MNIAVDVENLLFDTLVEDISTYVYYICLLLLRVELYYYLSAVDPFFGVFKHQFTNN